MTTFIIAGLSIWTIFGLCALFAIIWADDHRFKLGFKHLVLFGPVLGIGLIIVGLFTIGINIAIQWANKK
jgi:hypothetical protein